MEAEFGATPGTFDGEREPVPGAATPPPATPTRSQVSSAPLHWLLLGITSAILGVAIPFVTESHPLAIVGWLLGGTISILLLGAYLHFDLKRRAEGLAGDSALAPWLRRLLLVLAAAAVGLNAWTIADAVARRSW